MKNSSQGELEKVMGRGSRIGAPCYNAGESLNEPSNLKLFWLNFQMEFVESSPSLQNLMILICHGKRFVKSAGMIRQSSNEFRK